MKDQILESGVYGDWSDLDLWGQGYDEDEVEVIIHSVKYLHAADFIISTHVL
jgi:hypothetical protein